MRLWITLACCTVLLAADPTPQLARVWADALTNTLGAPSRDGRWLSFVDVRTGDLALRDLRSGGIRRLTQSKTKGEFAYFSAISPDSKYVAYAWFNDDKHYDLRLIGTDGGGARVIYRNEEAGFVQPCAWSPDGSHILTLFFRKDNTSQIALVPVDGTPVRVLKSLNWVYPKRMDISPDGKFIVYDSFAGSGAPEREVYLLATDGSRETTLIEHPANDLFPLWSPDGSAVYFASDRAGTMDLWRMAIPTGTPELISRDVGRFLPMGFTSEGTLYYGLREGQTDIYIAGAKPLRLATRFPGRNSAPEWSPDGRRIAFLSRRGTENYGQESRAIVVRSLPTGEERELGAALAHIERVRWSPDGEQLLVSGSDGKGRAGVYAITVATGVLKPVIAEPEASFRGFEAAWVKGGAVAYARDRRLYVAGRELATLSCEPSHLAANSDGTKLAFSCGESITVVPLKGEPAIISTAGPVTGLRWTRDDRLLFTAGPAVYRAGEAAPVAKLAGSRGDISLHPDGRQIAFTAGETRSEVWALRTRE